MRALDVSHASNVRHVWHVLIIGAGLGGLCLAHSLRRSGVAVTIFERDASPWDRAQGYRLHLEADALHALREALPAHLHALFQATAMRTEPFTTILRPDLGVVKRIPTSDGQDPACFPGFQTEETIHCNVDRATLRQILLSGLEDACAFDKRFVRYETHANGVTAFFADGTQATGDVLVGADGIRSPVRHQRAPHATTMDAGVQAIYGRIPRERAEARVPREAMTDIFAIAADERKVFLGLGAVSFPTPPQAAAARCAPGVTLKKQDDYVVCIVGGRHEHFPRELHGATSARLQEAAVAQLAAWPAEARAIVASGNPSSFFLVDMSTSVPFALDAPTNVTLLGDAVHAMTPTLGRGANLAMRDGALLGRRILEAASGRATLAEALAGYEIEMLRYGFEVVRASVAIGAQRMGQTPLRGGCGRACRASGRARRATPAGPRGPSS